MEHAMTDANGKFSSELYRVCKITSWNSSKHNYNGSKLERAMNAPHFAIPAVYFNLWVDLDSTTNKYQVYQTQT